MRKIALLLVLSIVLTITFAACAKEEEIVLTDELVDELIATLRWPISCVSFDPPDDPTKDLIPPLVSVYYMPMDYFSLSDSLKNNASALLVQVDADACYFVCAYYNSEHRQTEKVLYCCAENYTWTVFNQSEDIPNVYNGQEFVAAFQINKTSYCKDIVNPGNKVKVESFQRYSPSFEDGKTLRLPGNVVVALFMQQAKRLSIKICFIAVKKTA